MKDGVAEVVEARPAAAPRRRWLGRALGLGVALAVGGGGFYAVRSGLFDPSAFWGAGASAEASAADVAFIAIEPIVVTLPPGRSAKLLRFSGHLEVVPEYETEVGVLMPRVRDVLNTYLRAVDVADLEQPAALMRLRSQMLRRVQVVVGDGRVRDLLVIEFLLT
jgi:flagellar FliL protein